VGVLEREREGQMRVFCFVSFFFLKTSSAHSGLHVGRAGRSWGYKGGGGGGGLLTTTPVIQFRNSGSSSGTGVLGSVA
jgi:hypothetical protein